MTLSSLTDTACRHASCNGEMGVDAHDPALPPHVTPYECLLCGERYLHNTRTGELEVDA